MDKAMRTQLVSLRFSNDLKSRRSSIKSQEEIFVETSINSWTIECVSLPFHLIFLSQISSFLLSSRFFVVLILFFFSFLSI